MRRAFLAVPRECFLPAIAKREGLERVYRDEAILTAFDQRGVATSSSSQPSIMAAMLERLDLRRGHAVLEVGSGTGYNAALLTKVVGSRGRVVSIELDSALARGARHRLAGVRSAATVVRGDGLEGWARGAPYDRIIVTASAPIVPRAWHDQLIDGGLLELPLVVDRGGQAQMIVTFQKEGDRLRSKHLLHGGFMPLRHAPGAQVPSPPTLAASERIDQRPRSLAHLSGEALRRLSARRRQRLLSLALSEPRTRKLPLRAPRLALGLYLTIEAPKDRLIGGWPRVGVIGRDGEGLALLAGGARTVTRIESYGDSDAEGLLLEVIQEWKDRGRPGSEDLHVEVSLQGQEARGRMRFSWGP